MQTPPYQETWNRIEVVSPIMIVAAWFAASWHWIAGRAFIPWDSIDAFFPQVAFIVTRLRQGELPFWNPLVFGGQPVLGDPQSMLFTPHVVTGLLSRGLFGLHIFDVTTLACVLVGGLCLFAYLRCHDAGPRLAVLGAVVFMLGGVATSRLQHVPQIISYGLLPAFLLSFHFVMRRPGPWNAIALGLVAWLLVVNPNQVVFLAPVLLAPLLAIELAQARARGWSLLALAGSATILALGAAPSLSAILDTVGESNRRVLSLGDSAPASLPGFTAFSMILPGLFGIYPGGRARWTPADATESYLYLGIIPIAIILWGMCRKQSPALTLVATWVGALFAFGFAMGVHGPVYLFLFDQVPGFNLFRRPSDAAYFLNLYAGLAVGLAAAPGSGRVRGWAERLLIPIITIGLLAGTLPGLLAHAERLHQKASLLVDLRQFGLRITIALGAGFVIWRLLRADAPRWGKSAAFTIALGLTVTDLTMAGRNGAFTALYSRSENAKLFHRLDRGSQLDLPLAASIRALQAADARGWRTEVIGGDLARLGPIAFGIPLAQGYNPLRLRRYVDVFAGQNLGEEIKQFTTSAPGYDAAAYRWLGLRFVLLHGYIVENAGHFGAFGTRVFEIRRSLLESGARRLPSDGTYQIFELPSAYQRGGLIPMQGGEAGPPVAYCQVVSASATRLSYTCDPGFQARLVIGDSFASGWMACVNGASVAVMPFLDALRYVEVPAGRSQVELR
ncbi:MAG: hypothetical protein ING02_13590 [Roseomonas sp.]|nr:hypothetical protein [Roseomonas sp.]